MNRTKTFFLSDAHLGAPYIKDKRAHEMRLVHFLESIKEEAKEIYFLGDIFDFWFEYKQVIPKGYTRFLGKVAELSDSGINIHFFGGNHDMWVFDYFKTELGLQLHHKPTIVEIDNKTFFLAHGEDLGVSDKVFKLLLRLFRSHSLQWLFENLIHPNIAIRLAQRWSVKSRHQHGKKEKTTYLGEDKEHLVLFAKNYKGNKHIDYFIFGHRHIALDLMLKKDSRVIILGDWISQCTYAVVENGQLLLTEQTES